MRRSCTTFSWAVLFTATGVLALPSSVLGERGAGNVYTLPVGFSSPPSTTQQIDSTYKLSISKVNITLDGQTLPVLVDTGSGDLFVANNKCNVVSQQSGCYLSQTYKISKSTHILNEDFATVVGLGSLYGVDSLQSVSADGTTMLDQLAVPLINYTSAVGEFQNGQFSGILGLNTRNVSRNWYFNNRLPLMDTLLAQKKLSKPLFSVTIPRRGDPDSIHGALTIGGIPSIPAASTIKSSEIIDTINWNYDNLPLAPQGWTVQLQAIRVNGKAIPAGKGEVDAAGRYLALMDTGSSRMLFRREEVELMIAAFKGDTIVDPGEDVYFDCSIAQLIELKFHDTWFSIDPLDMIVSDDHGNVNGTELCHAPIGSWDRAFGDAILGPTFLKNALSVFDYVSDDVFAKQPRVGLAPLTNAAAAVKRYSSLYQQRLL